MSRKPTNEVEDWVHSDGAEPSARVIRDYILSVERERDEAVKALTAMFAAYEDVYDMAIPERHQSEEAKRACDLARAVLATIKEPKSDECKHGAVHCNVCGW